MTEGTGSYKLSREMFEEMQRAQWDRLDDDSHRQVMKAVVKAEDDRIRNALIELGWTPPDMLGAHDDAVAKAAVEDYVKHKEVPRINVNDFGPESTIYGLILAAHDRKVAVRTLREAARKAKYLGRVSGSGVDVGERASKFLEAEARELEQGVTG